MIEVSATIQLTCSRCGARSAPYEPGTWADPKEFGGRQLPPGDDQPWWTILTVDDIVMRGFRHLLCGQCAEKLEEFLSSRKPTVSILEGGDPTEKLESERSP